MITIDDALNIEVSQYDTFALKFIFKNYKLDTDDKVVFSIKATTTEKLGFTGREEGISAYAVVLIVKE